MIWRIYIYGMVIALATATVGSFIYLVVDPPPRLARTSYGLDRFTTPPVLLPETSGSGGSTTPRSISIDELIRSYQASAAGSGTPASAKAISAPTGC
ncbi:MAG TPA: hypothetical protein ENG84_08030 [Gammaproteobacteria bacterium]|nr:hypothetical protein BMS3Abin12_02056 [bacterium BMS3Abin12]HDK03774.1 hypothetical protein [Gammaproteobacteria bacterium]